MSVALARLLQNACQKRTRRTILLLGMLTCAVFMFHAFSLPSLRPSPPSFPTASVGSFAATEWNASSAKKVGKFSLLGDPENLGSGRAMEVVEKVSSDGAEGDGGRGGGMSGVDGEASEESRSVGGDSDDGFDVDDGETDPDLELEVDIGNGVVLKKVRDPVGGFITLLRVNGTGSGASSEMVEQMVANADPLAMRREDSLITQDGPTVLATRGDLDSPNSSLVSSDLIPPAQLGDVNSSLAAAAKDSGNGLASDLSIVDSMASSRMNSTPSSGYALMKKKRRAVPTLSIAEMNNLLLKTRVSYRSMRPRWSSAKDQQILAVRSKIDNPPVVQSDKELYAPAFRNLSMFRRSYALMEQTLKVYVYREGNKPIFHQPLLKGIYASEGWFMKLMEGNKQFVVRDPRKAHLFYLPFSSRFLEFSLYVPNSHNRMNLREFLGNYVNTIAAKYPFWNRTGGADHFLVACHDWAPFETKNVMDRPIRALCNADLANDFRLGKDVSLPESYVRFGRDPLRDIGGKPAEGRNIFAFYAGSIHGYLRPILLEYWENKDPDMKILGPMPPGVRSKMSYIQYMKNSKYCICPRGYEVNSPRVVEAIFYECVPVIISDNYVPPFFEVLDWEAFSVFVAEADIPKLKDILMSIPEEKYRSLQMGVKKVQQHFVWHPKAAKYDMFHMTLHSIWYNRIYTMKPR